MFSDILEEYYFIALEYGVKAEDFYNMSPMEIFDTVRAHNKREERQRKKEIWDIFLKAEVMARYITKEEGKEPPRPWEYYPDMFEEERKEYESTVEKERFEDYKDRRRTYVEEMNRRRRES